LIPSHVVGSEAHTTRRVFQFFLLALLILALLILGLALLILGLALSILILGESGFRIWYCSRGLLLD
jgi:hypothetical protein